MQKSAHTRQPLVVALGILIFTIVGCGQNELRNVPPGYIAKILTPTGWKSDTLEAGQVDIGELDNVGRGNQLVLCEATSFTIKESFAMASEDGKEDHRVITKSNAPIAADIYIQVMVPDDGPLRESIFAQVTPSYEKGDNREGRITLEQIYSQFAKMTVRGKTRQIFASYKDYSDVMSNYDRVTAEVAKMVSETFKTSKVPLKLVATQLSNVKADQKVWDAENRRASADAEVAVIEKIGEAIRRNPGYLEKYKWDTLREAAGEGTTIIVTDDGKTPSYNIPVGGR